MRLSELHELMHPRYSQPGLSRLVQRMEADGLVERRADPDDGRATVLQMTRAGRPASRGPTRSTPMRCESTSGVIFRPPRRARSGARSTPFSEHARLRPPRRVPFGLDDQVHRFEAPPGSGARRARVGRRRANAVDLFTGTTRVAQELKRRGMHVTAVDSRATPRCSPAATSPPIASMSTSASWRRRWPTSRHATDTTAT